MKFKKQSSEIGILLHGAVAVAVPLCRYERESGINKSRAVRGRGRGRRWGGGGG